MEGQEGPFALSIKLCLDKSAYEVRMRRKIFFKMEDAKRLLEEARTNKILVYTPHIMIFQSGNAEVTLSKDGRMLIKKVHDEDAAMLTAHKMFQTILKLHPKS